MCDLQELFQAHCIFVPQENEFERCRQLQVLIKLVRVELGGGVACSAWYNCVTNCHLDPLELTIFCIHCNKYLVPEMFFFFTEDFLEAGGYTGQSIVVFFYLGYDDVTQKSFESNRFESCFT